MFIFNFFLVEKGAINQIRTQSCWGNGGSPKMRRSAYRGRGCHTLCVCTYLQYLFSYFWQHVSLIVSCFICRNLKLPLFKKDVLFFLLRVQFLSSFNKLFSLKIIFVIKVSQNAFNFN